MHINSDLRIFVLDKVLETILASDKKVVQIKPGEIAPKINDNDVGRCLGDLSKALPLYMQLDPHTFVPLWFMKQPTVEQVAAALNIAMTGGTCTSWVAQGEY